MATTAPMRAKANVITEINARSRKPTRVDVSMLSRRFRACSPVSTVVLPVLTTCFGPRTAWAGLVATTWPVTSQSNSMRMAALLQRCWRVGILRDFGAKGFRFSCWERIMPFKLHSKGRRHIPRQRHRVTNWREYDASLRNRGSLTIWFTPEAIAGWKAQPRTTPGGQRHYSD